MNTEQRKSFIRSLLKMIDGVLCEELDTAALIGRLESGLSWLRDVKKKEEVQSTLFDDDDSSAGSPRSTKLQASPAEITGIFEYWQKATKRPRATLDNKRRGLIRNALRNYSADQLRHIITWCASDPHYSGANDRNKRYDWIETMFRSVARIEDLLERSQWGHGLSGLAGNLSNDRDRGLAERARDLKERSLVALRENRIDEYNALQGELSSLIEGEAK